MEEGEIGTYNDLSHCFEKGAGYMGIHTCCCGATSTAYDIILPNKMVTNSLAYHYIAYHTAEVPEIDWFKLALLKEYIELKVVESGTGLQLLN